MVDRRIVDGTQHPSEAVRIVAMEDFAMPSCVPAAIASIMQVTSGAESLQGEKSTASLVPTCTF